MPKPLIVVAALVVACLSAAAGWFGVKAWRSSQPVAEPTVAPTPESSPSPGESTISLTFDVDAVIDSVMDLHQVPSCGDTYAPEAHIANNVQARVDGAVMLNNGVETLEINPGFRVTGRSALGFLASEGTVIVTRDDVVVWSGWGAEFVPEYYAASPHDTMLTQGGVSLAGSDLCDAADQLSAIWSEVDWATATDAEISVAQDKAAAFEAQHKELPAGEYRLYMLSPVVVGEPAAIARMLTEEGISGLATLQYTIGYSTLADDPAIQEYCEVVTLGDGEATERRCDVPPAVLADVLRREVPASYVVDGAPDEAVSEAYSITVD